jgi:5'/3'-nucleotidase
MTQIKKDKADRNKPLIFITNDDGIRSPGLHALASALLSFADVLIVAPSNQMTAAGRGLSGDRGANLEQIQLKLGNETVEAWHAPCSPAQVVILGVQIFGVRRFPDLLISGINYGENMGRDITMSGTVGAAIQGACMGIPSLAVSTETPIDLHFKHGEVDWSTASWFAAEFARKMLEKKLPSDVELLKLDVPQSATRETPWRMTHLANQSYFSARIPAPDVNSTLSDSEVKVMVDTESLNKDSDVYAFLVDRVVSVTPLSLDFTSRTDLGKLAEYMGNDHGK